MVGVARSVSCAVRLLSAMAPMNSLVALAAKRWCVKGYGCATVPWLPTLAMVGCLGVVGYLMTLPNDVSSVGLYAIVGAFTSTVVLGFELAAHRRIKNALQDMALPAANVVAE